MKQIFVLLATVFISLSCYGEPVKWRQLAPDLEYSALSVSTVSGRGKLHSLRFAPQAYAMEITFADETLSIKAAHVKKLAKKARALLAINGGFFTPQYQPLGLRISGGQILNPLRNTSWWGVFYMKNNQPHIVSAKSFRRSNKIQFAIQAGPRLLINNTIPHLKGGLAERSALGITRDGKVVVVITEHAPLSTTQLAKIMNTQESQGGLECTNALNLDGGSSSQMYAKVHDFRLYVPSLSPVTDVITVKPIENY